MKQYVTAAFLISSHIFAQERTCEQLKTTKTFEGRLMDGCREKMQLYGGCGANITAAPDYAKIDLEGMMPFKELRKLHGKDVTVTGTYYDDYPLYITQCEKGTAYRGIPQKYLEIDMIAEIKRK